MTWSAPTSPRASTATGATSRGARPSGPASDWARETWELVLEAQARGGCRLQARRRRPARSSLRSAGSSRPGPTSASACTAPVMRSASRSTSRRFSSRDRDAACARDDLHGRAGSLPGRPGRHPARGRRGRPRRRARDPVDAPAGARRAGRCERGSGSTHPKEERNERNADPSAAAGAVCRWPVRRPPSGSRVDRGRGREDQTQTAAKQGNVKASRLLRLRRGQLVRAGDLGRRQAGCGEGRREGEVLRPELQCPDPGLADPGCDHDGSTTRRSWSRPTTATAVIPAIKQAAEGRDRGRRRVHPRRQRLRVDQAAPRRR